MDPGCDGTEPALVSLWASSQNPQARPHHEENIRQTPAEAATAWPSPQPSGKQGKSEKLSEAREAKGERNALGCPGWDGPWDGGMTLGKKHGRGNEVWTSITDVPGLGHEL